MTVTDGERVVSRNEWYDAVADVAPRSSDRLLSSSDVQVAQSYSGGRPNWFESAISRLQEIATWRYNWDGFGAEPVSALAVKRASAFGRHPMWIGTPQPNIGATPTGDVVMEWRQGAVEVEAQIPADGPVSIYVADTAHGFEWEGPLGQEPDGIDKWAWRLNARV